MVSAMVLARQITEVVDQCVVAQKNDQSKHEHRRTDAAYDQLCPGFARGPAGATLV
jgi:hypothetical protein